MTSENDGRAALERELSRADEVARGSDEARG
jgi:hypothetical protein